ncbi:hypothetical protein LINGRAHAP2_LOCUS9140 [Linum grandiflorum]
MRFDVVSRRKEDDSFTRGSPTTPLYEFLGLKRFRIYSRRHCRPTARPYVSSANHSEKQEEQLPILHLTNARVIYSVAPAMGHNQEAHPESHFRVPAIVSALDKMELTPKAMDKASHQGIIFIERTGPTYATSTTFQESLVAAAAGLQLVDSVIYINKAEKQAAPAKTKANPAPFTTALFYSKDNVVYFVFLGFGYVIQLEYTRPVLWQRDKLDPSMRFRLQIATVFAKSNDGVC